jgi:hypothetical protein
MKENENPPRRDGETAPLSDRRDRNAVDPKSQPGEFVDEMRTNRFTPPPDPKIGKASE